MAISRRRADHKTFPDGSQVAVYPGIGEPAVRYQQEHERGNPALVPSARPRDSTWPLECQGRPNSNVAYLPRNMGLEQPCALVPGAQRFPDSVAGPDSFQE